ncbi:IclR family transcriptional regulator (plasmid) [Bradyrhizobium sp. PMVTL-01]|uniref:IclR family transcriptional regulator n=1 Tax=Bradyrhizobium sp. PMVTL-01 TaxID=3434999 RepID=UPI003F70C06A
MAGVTGLWRVQKKLEAQDSTGASSVERVLAILTAFKHGDRALSLVELAERTGLVKSTILRHIASLQRFRLVARLPDGRYRLDAEILRLGTTYQHAFSLQDYVVPTLEQLADQSGKTAMFYVPHGDERLCLFRVEGANPIRLRAQPGEVRPMDNSAVAQVLRRYASTAKVQATEGVVLYTSGVADPHTAALATPVFGAGETLIGAVAIAGPATRLTPEKAQSLKEPLSEAGIELTRLCSAIPVQN